MNEELKNEIEELQEALSDLKSNLQIDPYNLDEECRRQPVDYDTIGQLATIAKSLSRKAKDTLDYTEADLRSKIRKDPESYGINGKVTEGSISEAVDIQKELLEAKSDYIEISKVSDGFSILVASMEQRRKMLSDLVSLYVHKYYSNQDLMGEEKQLDDRFEQDVAEERSKEQVEED